MFPLALTKCRIGTCLMVNMKTHNTGLDGRDITVATPAKINLFFELRGKRPDGFHEVETVMATVSLLDQLYLRQRQDGEIRLTVTGEGAENIPVDSGNLVYQALDSLRKRFGRESLGCDVLLEKRIPAAAGLGGASGNAAGALLAGRRLWQIEASDPEIEELSAELGSDVPFFLTGGFARCTGRGERIEKLGAPTGLAVVIAKPKEGLSTREVYQRCVVPALPKQSKQVVDGLISGDCKKVADGLFNRLESVATHMSESVENMRSLFDPLDCLGHQMSGSGSAWFGLFRNLADAKRAAKVATRNNDNKIFVCTTTGEAASVALANAD